MHPWCQYREIVDYCKNNDIVVQAYCPLVRGRKSDDPTLKKIAENHKRDPGQILIRWSLQKGFSPLPKSSTPSRILSNSQVYDFNLSDEEMAVLDALDQGVKGEIAGNDVYCD